MSKANDVSHAASFWCISHFTYRALPQKLDIQMTGAASHDSLGIAVNDAARNRRTRRKQKEKAVGLFCPYGSKILETKGPQETDRVIGKLHGDSVRGVSWKQNE
jgi:hypothetical protein